MNRKQAYNLLSNNAPGIISFIRNGNEINRRNVSVDSTNPQYEYDSLTTPFLFYSVNNGQSFEKVAWKNVTRINGVHFTDGKG